jgi:hypothetical protein
MKKIVKKKNYCIENTCNKSITGFIVVNVFTPSIKNPNKILLNNTSFLLNNNKFFIEDKIITNISSYLKENLNIHKSNNTILLETSNITIYLVCMDNVNEVNKINNINMKKYKWRKYIDFYNLNDNIYFSILNSKLGNLNSHLDCKLQLNNYDNNYIRLRYIYKKLMEQIK